MASFFVEVYGDYACFTRPELKVERVTYDVMTPSAARGILDSILWHPGMRWVIKNIFVLSPIRYVSIKRNEIGCVISCNVVQKALETGSAVPSIVPESKRMQRLSVVLRDVHYVIEADIQLTKELKEGDTYEKFVSMASRRLQNGQSYRQPVFGVREFPAQFRIWDGGQIPAINESRNLGLMLFDMDYAEKTPSPLFFSAALENGVMRVPMRNSSEVLK